MIHRSLTLPRDIILLLIETALQFLARFIYIYIYRACRCFVPWGSIAFDERLTNETSVRDRITKRVLFITGRVEDDTRQGR